MLEHLKEIKEEKKEKTNKTDSIEIKKKPVFEFDFEESFLKNYNYNNFVEDQFFNKDFLNVNSVVN